MIHHPRCAPGEQSRRLQVGLHVHEVALQGRQSGWRNTVSDLDARLGELLAYEVDGGAADADCTGRDGRAGRVESRHDALEAFGGLLHLRIAEEIVERDAAILEHDHRRVGGADAHLLLDLGDRHSGRPAFDDERLDPGAAGGTVEGRPDDDETIGLLSRHQAAGHKDLGAVDDPVVPVTTRRRGDRGRVGTATRFGDRHGAPFWLAIAEAPQDALLLFGGARGGYRGATESGVGNGEVQSGIAPRQLFDGDRGSKAAFRWFVLLLLGAHRR